MPNIRSGYSKGILLGLIGGLLLVSVLACAKAPAPPPERAATIVVEPASGKAAVALKIKGSNFLPDEEVEVILTVGEVRHALGTEKTEKIVADKTGAFEVASGIPVNTKPGTYTIKATGSKGSIGSFNLEVK